MIDERTVAAADKYNSAEKKKNVRNNRYYEIDTK